MSAQTMEARRGETRSGSTAKPRQRDLSAAKDAPDPSSFPPTSHTTEG